MAALDLFDDRAEIWKTLFVRRVGEVLAANDAVEFFVGLGLDFGEGGEECKEPLDNG